MPATTLNGQMIGRAQHATRAILDRLLARCDTTFHQWVALNLTTANGNAVNRADLDTGMTGALKISDSAVAATIAELIAADLVVALSPDGSRMGLTETGRARYRQISDALGQITARLYGDLPIEDLQTAGRVLTVVTARADAELAGGR